MSTEQSDPTRSVRAGLPRRSRSLPIGDAPAWSWLDKPWSQRGYSCDYCGERLHQADMCGEYDGFTFRVKGYICPICGNIHPPGVQKYDMYDWKRQLAGAGFTPQRKSQQVSSIDLTSRKKTCPHCGEEKLLTEFSRNAASHDGRQSWCKACSYERLKAARRRKRGEVPA